jgi:hypothetical protein
VPALQLQDLDDLPGQKLKRLDFGPGHLSRIMIDGAKSPEGKAIGSLKWNSSVEANFWIPGNERVV